MRVRLLAAGLVVAGACLGFAQSPPPAQDAIQLAYDKSCEAARWKFYDGIQATRTADFVIVGPKGHVIPGGPGYRVAYERLLGPALAVNSTVEVVGFKDLGGGRALCEAKSTLALTILEKNTPVTRAIQSESKDEWICTPKGWRLKASRLTKQSVLPHRADLQGIFETPSTLRPPGVTPGAQGVFDGPEATPSPGFQGVFDLPEASETPGKPPP